MTSCPNPNLVETSTNLNKLPAAFFFPFLLLDIVISHKQTVESLGGSHTSSTLLFNTGAPQDWVLSPHLFTLYTHNCSLRHQENSIVDHTIIIDRIIKQQ